MTPDERCAQSGHDWVRVDDDPTRRTGYRFCGRCDREEYDDGRVQPGWRTDPTSAEGSR